jgi:hypothetical protein
MFVSVDPRRPTGAAHLLEAFAVGCVVGLS